MVHQFGRTDTALKIHLQKFPRPGAAQLFQANNDHRLRNGAVA